MNILIIHRNFFYDGGDSTYVVEQAKALSARGYHVEIFTIEDSRNLTGLKDIVVNEIPNRISKKKLTRFDDLSRFEKFRYGLSSIFSIRNAWRLFRLLSIRKVDIIHLHSIHHVLTPAILLPIKIKKVNTVWTLHDYKILCPSSNLFREGNICESCPKKGIQSVIKYKCKHGKTLSSISVAFGALIDKYFGVLNIPDRFITPSDFLAEKLNQYNRLERNKVVTQNNFIQTNFISSSNKMQNAGIPSILFFGNLSHEKGVHLIPEIAMNFPSVKFKIVGSGYLRSELEEAIKKLKLQNIFLVGYQDRENMIRHIQEASFIIVPSQWYENFPFVLLESFSFGKTAIASKIGGIPEIIEDGYNGILVDEYHEVKSWIYRIKNLLSDPGQRAELEKNALETVKKFDQDDHMESLISLYSTVKAS